MILIKDLKIGDILIATGVYLAFNDLNARFKTIEIVTDSISSYAKFECLDDVMSLDRPKGSLVQFSEAGTLQVLDFLVKQENSKDKLTRFELIED